MTTIQWFPGHMAKAKRQIAARLKLTDIVFELRDARAPKTTMNPMLMELIGNRPRIVLLTKADLADKKPLDAWLSHLKKQDISAMAINAKAGLPVDALVKESRRLLKEKLDKDAKRGLKPRPLRAMIVGVPNVGKSTLINKLVSRRATNVGAVPGITKHLQVIRIHEDLELLDTPGLLWPKFDDQEAAKKLVLIGSLKDSVVALDDVVISAFTFLATHYKQAFDARYGIDADPDNPMDIFDAIGKRRGCLKKGGEIDYDRVMEIFLDDFRNARFGSVMLDVLEDDADV